MPGDIERTAPQSLEAERAVLGGMITDPDILEDSLEVLKEDHFYLQRHREIFNTIVELKRLNKPVDILGVKASLERANKLETVGGAAFLMELTRGIADAPHTSYYTEIVDDRATLRQMIRIGKNMSESSYKQEKPASDILREAEEGIFDLAERRTRSDFVSVAEVAPGVAEYIENVHSREYDDGATRTRFTELDEMTTGFKPADYIVIAGATSSGKTAYALSIAKNVAIPPANVTPRGVGIFSLEMSADQLVTRLFSMHTKLDAQKMRKGHLSQGERDFVRDMIPQFSEAPIFIDDSANQDMMQIRSKARKLMRRHDIGLFIIDYLQLVKPGGGGGRNKSREQEIAEISRGIKAMAREMKCPVIALSQLSRMVERRTGEPRPRISDLRESGAIGQDADTIIFIYRPEYYRIKDVWVEGMKVSSQGLALIDIAKQRSGPVGDFWMVFNKDYTCFEDLDKKSLRPSEEGGGDEEEQTPWGS